MFTADCQFVKWDEVFVRVILEELESLDHMVRSEVSWRGKDAWIAMVRVSTQGFTPIDQELWRLNEIVIPEYMNVWVMFVSSQTKIEFSPTEDVFRFEELGDESLAARVISQIKKRGPGFLVEYLPGSVGGWAMD